MRCVNRRIGEGGGVVRLERFNLSTANATGCGIVFTIAY